MLPLTPRSRRHLFSQLSADQSARSRTFDLALIKGMLFTAELRAASGAGGIRTLTLPLKRRMRCRYATAPRGAGVCVSAEVVPTSFVLQGRVVRGGVEPGTAAQRWSAGDVSDRRASVTTPDRVQVGMVGVEPGHRRAAVVGSCSQGTRAAVTLHPVVVSQVRTAGLEPRPSLRDGADTHSWLPTRRSSRSPTLCRSSSP